MILYLSSEQHTNLLDFTGWYDTDSEMPIKKLVGNFVLKRFIIYDMRNFSHFTEVVLDRIAFEDSDAEFAEAIEEFLTMYNPRITVIYEGLKQDDPLFQALLDRGVGNIVCDTEIAAIQREIAECLSGQGMTRYSPKERAKKQGYTRKYRFDCKNIHIAVISSQPRMGATTTAIGLSAWLTAVGASVCYVEENSNKILSAMAAAYEMKPDGEGWLLDGVHYGTAPAGVAGNFVIHDLGHMPDMNEMAKGADLLLAVCGTKPYELPNSMRLLHRLEAVDAYVLCPFTHEKVREDYAAILRSDFHKVLFLDYQPEPTDGMNNAKQYQTMMTKYIAGI
ncbi:hypothetical protein [Caproicibacter fermentans]|uniref:Uncharacterized protein n=1 Tax=Caproicibacter fermentans TaxID=2576756 RepID=A0A7G8TF58_9FIRM|nr:hypothetical protein [Caproicibacter fermentans]QNK42249.1 hypothetical protein HCR03_08595 [Caproicibacter fermentans]